uniref:Uncharacterized protein n=1 Tax=Anguilla anguilla TaxID=7936 RepID=A0A0E9VMC2_ANGAN
MLLKYNINTYLVRNSCFT